MHLTSMHVILLNDNKEFIIIILQCITYCASPLSQANISDLQGALSLDSLV